MNSGPMFLSQSVSCPVPTSVASMSRAARRREHWWSIAKSSGSPYSANAWLESSLTFEIQLISSVRHH